MGPMAVGPAVINPMGPLFGGSIAPKPSLEADEETEAAEEPEADEEPEVDEEPEADEEPEGSDDGDSEDARKAGSPAKK
ncbi:hypothetical protein MRX96_045688 [Rhipicephalus microplus]